MNRLTSVNPPRFLHIHEQVAHYLRSELYGGRWKGVMPGRNQLVKLLEVSGKTVDLAFQQLENEGLLVAQGMGKKRKIVLGEGQIKPPSLRIQILTYERKDTRREYELELKYRLEDAGHQVVFADKTLLEMGMKIDRIEKFVHKTPADAWVVCAGSHDVLKWFSQQPIKAFALFGRPSGLPIASTAPRKIPAVERAVDEMVAFGHQRIVMMAREERRKPNPGQFEQAFLDRLSHHGIETSGYNLPDWKEDKKDFHRCLDSLFQVTPPTAMIVMEPIFLVAAMQYLAKRGIYAPEHVSLFCNDPDPSFSWCEPAIAHIQWDSAPLMRRVVQWAKHVAQGREDTKQNTFLAHFIPGETIGPAPK